MQFITVKNIFNCKFYSWCYRRKLHISIRIQSESKLTACPIHIILSKQSYKNCNTLVYIHVSICWSTFSLNAVLGNLTQQIFLVFPWKADRWFEVPPGVLLISSRIFPSVDTGREAFSIVAIAVGNTKTTNSWSLTWTEFLIHVLS